MSQYTPAVYSGNAGDGIAAANTGIFGWRAVDTEKKVNAGLVMPDGSPGPRYTNYNTHLDSGYASPVLGQARVFGSEGNLIGMNLRENRIHPDNELLYPMLQAIKDPESPQHASFLKADPNDVRPGPASFNFSPEFIQEQRDRGLPDGVTSGTHGGDPTPPALLPGPFGPGGTPGHVPMVSSLQQNPGNQISPGTRPPDTLQDPGDFRIPSLYNDNTTFNTTQTTSGLNGVYPQNGISAGQRAGQMLTPYAGQAGQPYLTLGQNNVPQGNDPTWDPRTVGGQGPGAAAPPSMSLALPTAGGGAGVFQTAIPSTQSTLQSPYQTMYLGGIPQYQSASTGTTAVPAPAGNSGSTGVGLGSVLPAGTSYSYGYQNPLGAPAQLPPGAIGAGLPGPYGPGGTAGNVPMVSSLQNVPNPAYTGGVPGTYVPPVQVGTPPTGIPNGTGGSASQGFPIDQMSTDILRKTAESRFIFEQQLQALEEQFERQLVKSREEKYLDRTEGAIRGAQIFQPGSLGRVSELQPDEVLALQEERAGHIDRLADQTAQLDQQQQDNMIRSDREIQARLNDALDPNSQSAKAFRESADVAVNRQFRDAQRQIAGISNLGGSSLNMALTSDSLRASQAARAELERDLIMNNQARADALTMQGAEFRSGQIAQRMDFLNQQTQMEDTLRRRLEEVTSAIRDDTLRRQLVNIENQSAETFGRLSVEENTVAMGVQERSGIREILLAQANAAEAQRSKYEQEELQRLELQKETQASGGSSIGGGGGMKSVLCIAHWVRGTVGDEVLKADLAYNVKHTDEQTRQGYYFWATDLSAKVVDPDSAKSKYLPKIINDLLDDFHFKWTLPIVQAWNREMAYRMGVLDKGSWLGKALLWVGVPICRMMGRILQWGGAKHVIPARARPFWEKVASSGIDLKKIREIA